MTYIRLCLLDLYKNFKKDTEGLLWLQTETSIRTNI